MKNETKMIDGDLRFFSIDIKSEDLLFLKNAACEIEQYRELYKCALRLVATEIPYLHVGGEVEIIPLNAGIKEVCKPTISAAKPEDLTELFREAVEEAVKNNK